jgi:hypothetical protein
MKFLICAVTAIVATTMVGCNKEVDNPTNPALVTYTPNTANSTWNYNYVSYAPNTTTGSYVVKATNKDTTINGKTYRVFTNSDGPNDYYAQVGTDYYQFTRIAALGTQAVELLFLKDVAVGTTWSETQTVTFSGFPAPITVPVNYQVIKKDYDTTISGKTYKGVTHIKTTLGNLSVSGFPITPVSDISNLYARGVGRLYSRTKINILVPLTGTNINVDTEVTLANYTIQ